MSDKQPITIRLGHLARRKGETDKDHLRRIRDFVSGADVRTKTDLVDWTGSPPFHLDRYNGAKK